MTQISKLRLLLQREQIKQEREDRYRKYNRRHEKTRTISQWDADYGKGKKTHEEITIAEEPTYTWYELEQRHKERCRVSGYNDMADGVGHIFSPTDWVQRNLYLHGTHVRDSYSQEARWIATRDSAIKVILAIFGSMSILSI